MDGCYTMDANTICVCVCTINGLKLLRSNAHGSSIFKFGTAIKNAEKNKIEECCASTEIEKKNYRKENGKMRNEKGAVVQVEKQRPCFSSE